MAQLFDCQSNKARLSGKLQNLVKLWLGQLSCLQNYLTMKAVLLCTVSYFTQTKQDNKNSGEIFYQLQWESGNRCFFRDNTKYFKTKTKTMKLMKILHVFIHYLFIIQELFHPTTGCPPKLFQLIEFLSFPGGQKFNLEQFSAALFMEIL